MEFYQKYGGILWKIACFVVGLLLGMVGFTKQPKETVQIVEKIVEKEVIVEKKVEFSSKKNTANKITKVVDTKTGVSTLVIEGFSSENMNLGVSESTKMSEKSREFSYNATKPAEYDRFTLGAFWNPGQKSLITIMTGYKPRPNLGLGVLTTVDVTDIKKWPAFSLGVFITF